MKKLLIILAVLAAVGGAYWYLNKDKAEDVATGEGEAGGGTAPETAKPYQGPTSGVMTLNVIKLGELLTVDMDIPKDAVDGEMDLEKIKKNMAGWVEFKTGKSMSKVSKDGNTLTPNKACEYAVERFNPNKVRNEGKPYIQIELNFSCAGIPTEMDVAAAFKGVRIKNVELSLINEDKSDKRTITSDNTKVGL